MKTCAYKRKALLTFGLLLSGLSISCLLWIGTQKRQIALNRQLIETLKQNNVTKALILVETGADPNTREFVIPEPSLSEFMNRLLHRSPVPVNESLTAFMFACGQGSDGTEATTAALRQQSEPLTLIQTMLARGAQVNAFTRDRTTALMGAAFLGRKRIVALLLERHADVNVTDSYGYTALMLAVKNHDPVIVQMLLAQGALVNIQNEQGYTALVYAVPAPYDDWGFGSIIHLLVARANENIIRQLMAHGADPNISNEQGQTAYKFARKWQHPDIIALFRNYRKRP